MTTSTQMELFYDATVPVSPKTRSRDRRKAGRIIAEMRRLHDELNAALPYAGAEKPQINSPVDAAEILRPFLEPLDHEELWMLLLNVRNRVIKVVRLYVGSVNTSYIRVAEIYKEAIIENASGILLAHNHPSGDPSPSPEDVAVTRVIAEAGKLLDIDLLDHLILGYNNRFTSLKDRGLLGVN
jgi:DNA repair protein RadC